MERVLQRLEGIERFLLKDPTLRTLAASQATAPFIGLRAEEVIKAVVNGRREQEIDMLQERLHAYERADCTDSMALKQMLADSTSEIARLERALLAKQDQLDIITKSHRQQSDQTQQKHSELQSMSKKHGQLRDEHGALAGQHNELQRSHQSLRDQNSALEDEIRELQSKTEQLGSKLRQQTERAESLHQTNLQQQADLYQFRSQCESLEKHVREATKKTTETENSLEQAMSKLRKTEFELRSESEKLFLSKQKQQELSKEVDQTRETLRSRERQLREQNELLEKETLKMKQANIRADSLERDKALLETQLQIQRDKQKNYLSKLEKKEELERLNLQLREELMVARSKDKTNKDDFDRLSQQFESTKAKFVGQLEQREAEIKTLLKIKAELEIVMREQEVELSGRHIQLNNFAEDARRSEHKLLNDIQGVKSSANKELARRDRKIEELNNEIRVIEGKLVELSKRLTETEERENVLIRQNATLLKEVKDEQESHLQTRQLARKKLSRMLLIVGELRSELKHTRKEHTICVKELSSLLVKHVDVLTSLIKQQSRLREREVEELSNVFKSEIEELQRLLSKRTQQLRKEAEIYRGEIAYRDQLLQKTTIELGSERKSNLALRETLNSQSKLNVIKRLQFEREISATKEKHAHAQQSTRKEFDEFERRYQEQLLQSRDKYNHLERKMDEITARKSASFRQ